MAGKLQKNFFSSFLTSPNFAILTDFFTLFVRGGILAQINKANFIFFCEKKVENAINGLTSETLLCTSVKKSIFCGFPSSSYWKEWRDFD